ncbi:hypothetical protein [Micromonospora sp. NPDC048830]|uniref:hypothetical protein n=1 Tax=Micromonospora sp. NPDC048830 TaxID=3364257 RepID=UPI003721755B
MLVFRRGAAFGYAVNTGPRPVPLPGVRGVLLASAPDGGAGDPPVLAPDSAVWFVP